MDSRTDYRLQEVLNYVIASQQADGGFPTYEYFPVWKPQNGWTVLPTSSPFITSNILYSLLEIGDNSLDAVIQKGCSFLLDNMEFGGYYRFWPFKSKQHAVPLDMDDTSVSSYILERCGKPVDNKAILHLNRNAKGYYYTWLVPAKFLLKQQPKMAARFALACAQGVFTRILRHYFYTDYEPGVAANALLYLGQTPETQPCIQLIIDEILANKYHLKFYEDELAVYYHIARAYKHGITNFGVLIPTIMQRIKTRISTGAYISELSRGMAANTLIDFCVETDLATDIILTIAQGGMCPDKWLPQTYFASRDRNFLAGSPQYTAIVYAEACSKLLRLNNSN